MMYEICAERNRLLHESTEAVSVFAAALFKLSEVMDGASDAAFEEMRTLAETARERMERARNNLARHYARHGCSKPGA
jgi:hypothetical protein